MSDGFVWRDAGRTVLFGQGGLGRAPELLAPRGFGEFHLLSTGRALAGASELAAAAEVVHEVAAGGVPDLAAALLDRVTAPRLVALGGGRVIDAAKAVASVTGATVAAIPTTLSGAELTGIHRLPAGAGDRVRGMVRPELTIADPEAMTDLPEPALRASAMNALAHGADCLYTPFANPLAGMAALRGAGLIAAALDAERDGRDADALAQGALLCAYAVDSAGFGLHHVVCQSLVRTCGCPHAETNAAILPRAAALLAGRAPEAISRLAAALGVGPDGLEDRLLELGGHPAGLGALGAERERVGEAVAAMLSRAELGHTPRPPDAAELRDLVESAW